MSFHSLLPVLVLGVTITCVSTQGKVPYDWRIAPYDDDDFNTRVHYTKDTVLECNDSRVPADRSWNVSRWITPELIILYPGGEETFETLDGTAGWSVSLDGFHLYINLTHDRHFGIYYCMLVSDDQQEEMEWVVKKAVNFKGAYWGNVWWRYEDAAIWGIVGSAICAGIFAVGAFLWTRFETAPESDGAEDDDFDAILAKLGYNNDAFTDTEGFDDKLNSKAASDMQIREMDRDHRTPTMDDPPSDDSHRESPNPSNDYAPDPYETVVEINGTKGGEGVQLQVINVSDSGKPGGDNLRERAAEKTENIYL